jgi:hypothetical protein
MEFTPVVHKVDPSSLYFAIMGAIIRLAGAGLFSPLKHSNRIHLGWILFMLFRSIKKNSDKDWLDLVTASYTLILAVTALSRGRFIQMIL